MNTLIFATNNQNKVAEIRSIIGETFSVVTLREAGIDIDIPEPYNTLEENAAAKSKTIYQLTGKDCFSEDTGLEVEALGGEPGVRSARYATDSNDATANIDKLLQKLSGIENRKASFRTVISLIFQQEEYLFEGTCDGVILKARKGDAGFGYDSVFTPEGSRLTFAEMTTEGKNAFSHRRKATDKLVAFLSRFGKE